MISLRRILPNLLNGVQTYSRAMPYSLDSDLRRKLRNFGTNILVAPAGRVQGKAEKDGDALRERVHHSHLQARL
jgi:hypothetical protein